MKDPKPVIHGRDHRLGGRDPITGLITSLDESVTIDTTAGTYDLSATGSITEVTSDDASVTVTNPTGPVVDLSVPVGITEITSTDLSVTITDPTGPIVDLSVTTGGGSGDYVFLDEVVVTATEQDTIEFGPTIDQTYRHLVIDASLQCPGDTGPPDDLWVDWGAAVIGGDHFAGDGFYQAQIAINGETFLVEDDVAVDSQVFIKGILPCHALTGRGLAVGQIFAQVTLKFDYYSVGDRASVMTWQAIAMVSRDGSDVTDAVLVHSTGGGLQDKYAIAIDRIRLACFDGFGAGSRASLYGIK